MHFLASVVCIGGHLGLMVECVGAGCTALGGAAQGGAGAGML